MISFINAIPLLIILLYQGRVSAFVGPQSQYSYNETEPTAGEFRWNITLIDPILIERPYLEQGIYRLRSTYLLDDNYYDMELFKDDCETPPQGIDNFPLEFYSASNNIFKGENEVEFEWTYNQTRIQMSDLWQANLTGGEVTFCIRVNNYLSETGDDFSIGVHFLEVLYKIEIDYLTDFNGTIDIIRTQAISGGIEEIDYEENIRVYQCNDFYHEIVDPPPLLQGDHLQICVETVDDTAFGVHSIKDIEISQNGTDQYNYIQNYVMSPLTAGRCKEVYKNTTLAVCFAKMQLLGTYYEEIDPDDILILGTVKLDYVGRRNMLDSTANLDIRDPFATEMEEHRSLQIDSTSDTKAREFGFKLNVELASNANESSSSIIIPGCLFTLIALLIGGTITVDILY